MIPLLSRDAVRAVDRDAGERLGLPTLVLMENAGRGAFDVLRARFPAALARVVIVGGPGQNGGDGWVVARHLSAAGHIPQAFLLGTPSDVRGDARVNWLTLQAMGVQVQAVDADLSALEAALAGATLVVDALFGTGLSRPLAGVQAEVVRRLLDASAPVVALDLPSGIDADSGAVLGVAVRAAMTVTFAARKRGLAQAPGHQLAGELHCVSIGVPAPACAPAFLIEASDAASRLGARPADAHKGHGGHVLVIAGAAGRTGAALLSGLGALRAGAGLCTLAPRAGGQAALDAKVIELMTAELPSAQDAAFARAAELAADKAAVVVGPGLGVDECGLRLARRLALELERPAVLDADALTAFAGEPGALRAARAPRVLTPHPGEAGRLLGVSAAAVQADRYAAAERLARETQQVVVLKGARTIVADATGRLAVCPTGTPAMAVAGTGDVLSGVIGAMLARLAPFDAALCGVYVHGLAGELASEGDRGLLASELAGKLPAAIARLRRESP